jgi:hypothetical protein
MNRRDPLRAARFVTQNVTNIPGLPPPRIPQGIPQGRPRHSMPAQSIPPHGTPPQSLPPRDAPAACHAIRDKPQDGDCPQSNLLGYFVPGLNPGCDGVNFWRCFPSSGMGARSRR